MIIPTKEILIKIVEEQGFAYNSIAGQDLFNNLSALTKDDWTGPEVKTFLMYLRDSIFPNLDVPKILRQLEIL